jgi:hypothetical protein
MMIDSVPTDVARDLSVFDMNTKAVVSLKEGRIQEGTEGLRATLLHTRSLLVGQEDRPHTANGSAGAAPMVPLLSLFTVPLFTPPGDKDAAHCPLFDRAFVVGGDDTDSWMGDTHCQNVTLSVLLYNLALSHHMSALHKGDIAINEYQVAMNLYQMALNLVEHSIQDEDDGNTSEECQNLIILLCAIFNNMANIHSRHFNIEETRNCLECVKEIVSQDYYVVNVQEEDQFFFYLNLFVTAPVSAFAIAPAA